MVHFKKKYWSNFFRKKTTPGGGVQGGFGKRRQFSVFFRTPSLMLAVCNRSAQYERCDLPGVGRESAKKSKPRMLLSSVCHAWKHTLTLSREIIATRPLWFFLLLNRHNKRQCDLLRTQGCYELWPAWHPPMSQILSSLYWMSIVGFPNVLHCGRRTN